MDNMGALGTLPGKSSLKPSGSEYLSTPYGGGAKASMASVRSAAESVYFDAYTGEQEHDSMV